MSIYTLLHAVVRFICDDISANSANLYCYGEQLGPTKLTNKQHLTPYCLMFDHWKDQWLGYKSSEYGCGIKLGKGRREKPSSTPYSPLPIGLKKSYLAHGFFIFYTWKKNVPGVGVRRFPVGPHRFACGHHLFVTKLLHRSRLPVPVFLSWQFPFERNLEITCFLQRH